MSVVANARMANCLDILAKTPRGEYAHMSHADHPRRRMAVDTKSISKMPRSEWKVYSGDETVEIVVEAVNDLTSSDGDVPIDVEIGRAALLAPSP